MKNAEEFGLKVLFAVILHNYRYRKIFQELVFLPPDMVFPMATVHSSCLLLSILNLAQPEWMFVPCSKNILHYALCVIPQQKEPTSPELQHMTDSCPENHIRKLEKCLLLTWRKANKTFSCPPLSHKSVSQTEKLNLFNSFIYARSLAISPVIFKTTHLSDIQYFEFDTKVKKYIDKTKDITGPINGFELCVSPPHNMQVSSQTHTCKNGVLIAVSLLFDRKELCKNDETSTYHIKSGTCQLSGTTGARNTCSPLLQKLQTGMCAMFLSSPPNKRNMSAQKISKPLFFDDKNHTLSWKDTEWVRTYIGNKSDEPLKCLSDGLLPCSPGTCFNISDICVYKVEFDNQLKVCANGVNLEECEMFECNSMFKCPRQYCIPWEYVCDTKWDCPRGIDEGEVCLDKMRCQNFLLCRDSNQTCVHVGNLCDDVMNCPHGDDEILCELNGILCPTGCSCLALAVVCSNLKLPDTRQRHPYQSVSFCEFPIVFIETIFLFKAAIFMNLVDTNLKDVCTVYQHRKLLTFQVVYNNISRLKPNCFQGLFLLQSLTLSHNQITEILQGTLSGLTSLVQLNLSANRLEGFPNSLFPQKSCLRLLSLVNNSLTKLTPEAFSHICVQEIHTDKFGICCVVPIGIVCSSGGLWFESCTGIFHDVAMKGASCFFVSVGFIINWSSTYIHLYSEQYFHKSYRYLAVAGNMDFLFFLLYYCIMFAADEKFGLTFVLQDTIWRSSVYCKLSCWLLVTFCLLSPATKVLLSFSRLMVVWFPIETRFKQTSFASKAILLVWSSILLLSSLAAVFQSSQQSGIPSRLCSPFSDPHKRNWASLLITGFLILSQFIAMGMITVIHVFLFKVYKQTTSQLYKEAIHKGSILSMKLQLFCLTFSACICWVPSCTVFLVALFLDSYPPNMTEWTTLTVVPLYSVLSTAILLSLVVRQYLQQNRKNKQNEK